MLTMARHADVMTVARCWPLIVALAGIAAWVLWGWSGDDIHTYLLPWLAHIRAAGPVGAFAQPFSDYAPPYLYLLAAVSPLADAVPPATVIKLLSVGTVLALAGAVWRLLRALGTLHPAAAATVVLLLPTVLLNAALLGQCDALWTGPCVMALVAAVERRHRAMLLWCGLALGIKLQAVFLAPFVLALLLARRVPLRLSPLAPAAWLATLLPAWLAGWPAADLLTIYLRQSDSYPALSLNAPNIWMVAAPFTLPLAGVTALALAAAASAALAYVAAFARRQLTPRALVEAALLSALMIPGLLPRMHERYFFLADVLALAVALAWPDRRSVTIALLVQGASCAALFAYISGIDGFAMLGAVAMIVATLRLARGLVSAPASAAASPRTAPDPRPAGNVPAPRA